MQKITKDMIIGDILRMDPEMAGVLVAGGMHCIDAHPHRWRPSKRQLSFMVSSRICW